MTIYILFDSHDHPVYACSEPDMTRAFTTMAEQGSLLLSNEETFTVRTLEACIDKLNEIAGEPARFSWFEVLECVFASGSVSSSEKSSLLPGDEWEVASCSGRHLELCTKYDPQETSLTGRPKMRLFVTRSEETGSYVYYLWRPLHSDTEIELAERNLEKYIDNWPEQKLVR